MRRLNKSAPLLAGIALAAAIYVMPAGAEAPTTADHNKALVAERFDAWSAGAGSPFDLLAEDAHWTITGNSLAAGTYVTREDFMRDVIRPFNARMASGLKPAEPLLYVDGDTVIAYFHASGATIDGGIYENTYAWFMTMQDGKIVDAYAFFDSMAFDELWRRVTPEAAR